MQLKCIFRIGAFEQLGVLAKTPCSHFFLIFVDSLPRVLCGGVVLQCFMEALNRWAIEMMFARGRTFTIVVAQASTPIMFVGGWSRAGTQPAPTAHPPCAWGDHRISHASDHSRAHSSFRARIQTEKTITRSTYQQWKLLLGRECVAIARPWWPCSFLIEK
jgi:hypothetical protein